ncbi:MAG: hypothetical protein COB84_05205 [Rhodobacteraceae bacterium]|nr:MAG: hypothetical protein COB84_05205 [Paracoccaceae bacterium]
MGRLIKFLFILVILGLIALAGYAYLGDISTPTSDIIQPVIPNET